MRPHSLPKHSHGAGQNLHYTASAPDFNRDMSHVLLMSPRSLSPSQHVCNKDDIGQYSHLRREPLLSPRSKSPSRHVCNQDDIGQYSHLRREPLLSPRSLSPSQHVCNKDDIGQYSHLRREPLLSPRSKSPSRQVCNQDENGQYSHLRREPLSSPRSKVPSRHVCNGESRCQEPRRREPISGTSQAKVTMLGGSLTTAYAATAADLRRPVSLPQASAVSRCAFTAADSQRSVSSHPVPSKASELQRPVVAVAPDSDVRDLCASLACEQEGQAQSLRKLAHITDVLRQQVQTLYRSTNDALMFDSEALKQEWSTAEIGATSNEALAEKIVPLRKSPMRSPTKPDPQLLEALDSKMAERDKEMKTWFAKCCVSAMKETFGGHLQRHEEAIKLLNSQFCTLGELTRRSLTAAEDISAQSEQEPLASKLLETIAELPDQDVDVPGRENDVLYLSSKESTRATHTEGFETVMNESFRDQIFKNTLEAWCKGDSGHVACEKLHSFAADDL